MYQWWNNDKCWCECKKCHAYKKGYVWNPSTCNCENGKYLASIMDNLVIICEDVIKSYNENVGAKSNDEKTNFNEKNTTCKIQNL